MMTNFEKTKSLIIKYEINKSMLARLLNIQPCTFNEKMSGARYSKFTPEQQIKITKFLKDLGLEINNL